MLIQRPQPAKTVGPFQRIGVERGARDIHDGVVAVVAFGQHGVDRGDGAPTLSAHASPLDQVGQQGKHRRWIAFGGGWFAHGQTNFTLGVGDAGQAVDQHEHVFALVAEVFGDHMGQVGGLQSQHRRHVGGRGHQHGFGHALFTQRLLDKGLHLAAALADQADHHHVGLGEAGEHAQQHTFADTRTGDQANALPAADGQHAIDGFDAHIEHIADGATLHRVERATEQAQLVFAHRLGFAVQWHAPAIDDTAQQGVAQPDAGGVADDAHSGPGADALRLGEGHEKQGLVVEAHHLGLDPLATRATHLTGRTQRRHDAARLHAQAHQTHQGAAFARGGRAQLAQQLVHLGGKGARGAVVLGGAHASSASGLARRAREGLADTSCTSSTSPTAVRRRTLAR